MGKSGRGDGMSEEIQIEAIRRAVNGSLAFITFEDREITVYTPPGYEAASASYPVVYVQDGAELFDPREGEALNALEKMFAAGELEPLILVGIEPKERRHEYTPWPAKRLAERFPDFGGNGAVYVTFVAEQVKPYIDRMYRTKTDRGHTGMIGASLGGLVSVFAAGLRPDVFGRIGSISGSFWYEGFVDYLRKAPLPMTDSRYYLYVGSEEGAKKTNIQKDMVRRNEQAFQLLLEKGGHPEDVMFAFGQGADHDLSAFTERFPQALHHLFRN